MKRDWDIVRAVLLAVEARKSGDSDVTSDDIKGVTSDVAAYNMWLLYKEGLAQGGGRDPDGMGEPHVFLTSLTWSGHELLDSMRTDTIWNRIKDTARQKGIELTVDAIKMLAKYVYEQVISSA